MAWEWQEQPTGEFKIEEVSQSPNGKLITLKGVRATALSNYFPGTTSAEDAQNFRWGINRLFSLFGLTTPGGTGKKGTRTKRDDLVSIS